MKGKVWLVGAGPGDPELLTIKAVKALSAADVVLMDDLVHPGVLAHVRPDARIVPVGKRGGCKSTPQAFIERLMVQEALAGRTVVRLKGGDPYLFGRGGEERLALLSQGIAVEVVNGLTSGLVAPSVLGIPLTHRDVSHGVIFLTGHAAPNSPQVDWKAVAATGLTLVIYMGVARVAALQAQLLAAELRGNLPVAIVQSATLSGQRALVSTLDRFVVDMHAAGLGSPAIIVVGEVVRLADARQLSAWASQAVMREP